MFRQTVPDTSSGDRKSLYALYAGFPRLLKVLDFFCLKIPGPGKSWKNPFGLGKSWKLKLKVMESPGKISLKVVHFSSGSNNHM